MRAVTLLFAVTAILEAQDAKPVLKFVDGGWERLQQGGVEPTPALQISSQMRVLLKSDSRSARITYRLIQHMHRRLESDVSRRNAERTLNGEASVSGSPGTTLISAHGPGAFATLEVYVPPQVKTADVIIVQSGDIEAYGFGGALLLRTPAGDIQADGIGGRVQAFTGGGHIQIGQVGGDVTCSTGAGSVTVASAGAVNCQTAGGEIAVKQARGAVALFSGGGNIEVDQAAQNVEAHSTRGEIVIRRAGGMVEATTGGGAIRIGSAAGVHAASASGPVYLAGATGALSVSTALGSILAELMTGARLQNSSLVTASGDITVMIPSNVALSVMATDERGGVPHVDSEFGGFRAPVLTFGRPPLAQGNINGGGPTMLLSGSDMIYLKRTR